VVVVVEEEEEEEEEEGYVRATKRLSVIQTACQNCDAQASGMYIELDVVIVEQAQELIVAGSTSSGSFFLFGPHHKECNTERNEKGFAILNHSVSLSIQKPAHKHRRKDL
jgi:hypothetical protein